MAEITKIAKDLFEIIKDSDKKNTSPYDTQADVIRVNGGTAYVHIPGGVAETPVDMTVKVKAGDKVQVRVSGGRAWITGNATAPPTDDRMAIQATDVAKSAQKTAIKASGEAAEAWEFAGTALDAATVANTAANSALESAHTASNAAESAIISANEAKASAISANNSANNALVQLSVVEDVAGTLRWISEHGDYVETEDDHVVSGTVYFVYQGGDYIPIASPDPTANPSTEGWYVLDVTESQSKYIMSHLAVTGAGLWVLPVDNLASHPLVDSNNNQIIDSNNNPLVDFSDDPQNASGYKVLLSGTGMTVFNGEGEDVAFYGEYAQVGKSSGAHSVIDANGQRFYAVDGSTLLANIGYGEGTAQSGTDIKPYYTFGTRKSGSVVGNYSVAEGLDVVASGYASHAEGRYVAITTEGQTDFFYTTASGSMSHAEGRGTTASGFASHSEGSLTTASGDYSHAQGSDCVASGNYSHAQGYHTLASSDYQTVIGLYNIEDTLGKYLFIIGNGYSDSTPRSNALTVDWDGNLTCGSMDSGRYQNVSVPSNSYADFSINFNKTFTSAPIVTATFWSTSTAAELGYLSLAVHTITATGFTVRVFNKDSNTRAPYINWIAMLT